MKAWIRTEQSGVWYIYHGRTAEPFWNNHNYLTLVFSIPSGSAWLFKCTLRLWRFFFGVCIPFPFYIHSHWIVTRLALSQAENLCIWATNFANNETKIDGFCDMHAKSFLPVYSLWVSTILIARVYTTGLDYTLLGEKQSCFSPFFFFLCVFPAPPLIIKVNPVVKWLVITRLYSVPIL